jgi:hypothetical protein
LFTGWRNQDRAVHILPLTDLDSVSPRMGRAIQSILLSARYPQLNH